VLIRATDIPSARTAGRSNRARIVRLVAAAFVPGLAIVLSSFPPPPAARAQSAPAAPAAYDPNSPHWSHIRVADFGRALVNFHPPATQQAAYEWYARHVDLMGGGMDAYDFDIAGQPSAYVKTLNPTIKTFGYDYDFTMCQSASCNDALGPNPYHSVLPEDQYLHFSEDTRLRFVARDGRTVVATIDVPGCPEPGPATSACRAQAYLWQSRRWLANVGNTAWQQAFADHLLDEMLHDSDNQPNPVDGLLLDGHGPGFAVPLSIGFQTVILSGGGIREYGGARPRNPGIEWRPNALDSAYTSDKDAWLAYLHSRLAAVGKFVHINTGEYFMDPLAFRDDLAARGAFTELLHAGFNIRHGGNQYQQFIAQMQQMTALGGSVDLAYEVCLTSPANYTAGNYPSAGDRMKMWNLAGYYMVKESVADSGIVYFDPNLCLDAGSPTPLDFMNEWLAAYEQDVGQPVDRASVLQHGMRGCASQEYKVFARRYTNALILVRPRDDLDCTDYGDNSAVQVALPESMQMLNPDGTRSLPMTSIAIRNAEAAILFPEKMPPDPIRNLHVW
jgi:hypothetical protein